MTAVATARDHPPPLAYRTIKAQLREPAIAVMTAALNGNDPLPRPWLTPETFAAAAAALER